MSNKNKKRECIKEVLEQYSFSSVFGYPDSSSEIANEVNLTSELAVCEYSEALYDTFLTDLEENCNYIDLFEDDECRHFAYNEFKKHIFKLVDKIKKDVGIA